MADIDSIASKWLSVVGIGESGLAGLSPLARGLVDRASIIVGGHRHLAMLDPNDRRERMIWTSPIEDSMLRDWGDITAVYFDRPNDHYPRSIYV
jgi:precorrin-6B methylase 1